MPIFSPRSILSFSNLLLASLTVACAWGREEQVKVVLKGKKEKEKEEDREEGKK
jgi:hypothetical protein